MIKAVLFDFDGTLVDSLEAVRKFVNDVLGMYGYKAIDLEDFEKNYFSIPLKEIFKKRVPNVTQKELDGMLKYSFKGYEKYIKLHDGAIELLERLSKKYILGIVTSRRTFSLELTLDEFKMHKYFKLLMPRESYENPKPHPESLLKALDKFKLKPEEAVYVGDNETDVKFAKAAGTKIIIFSKHKIKEADYNVNSLTKVLDVISGLDGTKSL
jgi:pyrophosphatase PpaX